jgi:hypothetical protein
MLRQKCANNHAVGVLLMISLFIIALPKHLVHVNPTPRPFSTMGITTRASTSKDKPTSRAIITTAATPKQGQFEQLAKSPCTATVNFRLAEINLPTNQFNNVLETLCPSTSPTDAGLNDPCNLMLPTDKNRQGTQLTSPMGVDVQEIEFHAPVNNASPQANKPPQNQTTSPSRSVRINETATLVVTMMNLSGGTSQRCQSILLSASNCNPPTTEPEPKEASPMSESRPSEIHDRDQMLYHVFSKDGMKEIAYHVTDFAGLYPVWPIVEFSMAPSGATKDERMTSFIKCAMALLGEMLYVDNAAMIALIDITNNNEASVIKSKADLPTNFTKLGKHIMISSGSWVF